VARAFGAMPIVVEGPRRGRVDKAQATLQKITSTGACPHARQHLQGAGHVGAHVQPRRSCQPRRVKWRNGDRLGVPFEKRAPRVSRRIARLAFAKLNRPACAARRHCLSAPNVHRSRAWGVAGWGLVRNGKVSRVLAARSAAAVRRREPDDDDGQDRSPSMKPFPPEAAMQFHMIPNAPRRVAPFSHEGAVAELLDRSLPATIDGLKLLQ
jgi:hypothetical protein